MDTNYSVEGYKYAKYKRKCTIKPKWIHMGHFENLKLKRIWKKKKLIF